MLQSIVGPPLKGPTDLKSLAKENAEKNFKGSGTESTFGKALDEKMSKGPKEPLESTRAGRKDTDRKESIPESSRSATRKTNTGDVGKKSLQRQQAIQEFMDSIESEFQISPTRLVEAMANLEDQQLVQAPEESAEAFIEQLGLSSEDSEKAQALYAGLLVQLNGMSQPPVTTAAMGISAGTGSYLGMQDRVSAQHDRKDMLNASLDRLSKNFWQSPAANANAEAATLAEAPLESGNLQNVLSQQTSSNSLIELPPHLQGQMKDVASPALLAALAAQKAQSIKGTEGDGKEAPADMSQLKSEFAMTAEGNQSQNGSEQKVAATAGFKQSSADTADLFSRSADSSLPSTDMLNSSSGAATEFSQTLGALESSLIELKESLTGLEQAQGVAPEALRGETLNSSVSGMTGAAVAKGPSEVDQQAAVQQVLKQAQFLVNKGGGEMNVQMSPEGMGTIHLKVMLQDGKVQVQMQAETPEAKHTIESSLAELKTSLAAQKLSMDNVKVDVVGQTSADTATQNQTQSNGHGQRDQSRQFWNQFNENFGSQGRRESLTEMQSLKSYGAKRDPLQAVEASNNRSARKAEGKGSGLNLVA